MKTTFVVRTLGCKANLADSQRIEAELRARGMEPWSTRCGTPAGVCVINSCTVTDEADRQTRKLAARLSYQHPGATVVVTGCAAEVDPERLLHSKGIRYIVGNRDKPRLVELILRELTAKEGSGYSGEENVAGRLLGKAEGYADMASRHPMDREWPPAEDALGAPVAPTEGASKTRLFLKIQEGCNSFCTYCVIPYGRGPSRSLEPEKILQWVGDAVKAGVKEIVFTGTNIGDYGTDWAGESRLDELLERVFGETAIERLRVSSLDPTEITPRLVSLMAREPRFCPHFHVSLQSASDRVLRLMKRKYGLADVMSCFDRIASVPAGIGGVFIGMDVITGFPGESAAEFEKGFEALQKLPWTRLHVFPYSERAGTPATRLPDIVSVDERQQRARVLNHLSVERLTGWHTAVLDRCNEGGKLERVLLEKSGFKLPQGGQRQAGQGQVEAWFAGYTPNYVRVAVPVQPGIRRNSTVSVRPRELITETTGGGEAIFVSELDGTSG